MVMDDFELKNVKPLKNVKKEAVFAGKQPMGVGVIHVWFLVSFKIMSCKPCVVLFDKMRILLTSELLFSGQFPIRSSPLSFILIPPISLMGCLGLTLNKVKLL